MRSSQLVSLGMIGLFLFTSANAEQDISGTYDCTVYQKAGIYSVHLEGADPPKAFGRQDVNTTFGMRIEASSDSNSLYVVRETENRGANPDRTEYHTKFSLFHSAYFGDGRQFSAADDQAFLRLHHKTNGSIFFYHAGFEYPGGEDVNLSVRFGECVSVD